MNAIETRAMDHSAYVPCIKRLLNDQCEVTLSTTRKTSSFNPPSPLL